MDKMTNIAVACATATIAMLPAPVHAADIPPTQCPAAGTAHSPANQALNVLKNRDVAPVDTQIGAQVTLAGMLADGDDHGRFDQGQGAEIVGYVTSVKQGGHPETANCGNMTLPYTDTHITVALQSNATETQTIVVEVTPRWREKMQQQGVDWSTTTLQTALVGHQVRFRGWLLFDLDHVSEAINTAPGNPRDWRKTVWEVHPITSMQIVQ